MDNGKNSKNILNFIGKCQENVFLNYRELKVKLFPEKMWKSVEFFDQKKSKNMIQSKNLQTMNF
jgi:hypothetical protein